MATAVTMALAFAPASRVWSGASAPDAQKVEVRVDSMVASDTHQGIDTQLTPMGPRLRSLFSYTTYHLVSHATRETPIGTTLAFDLPGGRILHVEPNGVDGDMIVMQVELFQGERPLMTTDLKLRNHGILIVGGPRYEQGMLIISIGADCRCGHSRTADRE
jgi:hypothetical protein